MYSGVQLLSKCPTTNKSFLEIWAERADVPKTLPHGQLCRGSEATADFVQNMTTVQPQLGAVQHLITKAAQ